MPQFSDSLTINAPKALDTRFGVFQAGSWRAYNDLTEAQTLITQPYAGMQIDVLDPDGVSINIYKLGTDLVWANATQLPAADDIIGLNTTLSNMNNVLQQQAVAIQEAATDASTANDSIGGIQDMVTSISNTASDADATAAAAQTTANSALTAANYRSVKKRITSSTIPTATVILSWFVGSNGKLVIEVDCSGASIILALPSAINLAGLNLCVIKVDSGANTVTLDPNGSETINDESTKIAGSQYTCYRLESNFNNNGFYII